MATKPKKGATKFVNTYSGRSGSSAALISPAAKRKGLTAGQKGGMEWGTDRMISSAGKKYGTSKDLGTEVTTVRSGANSKKTYVSKGKYAKPTPTNKKGR